jgi:hypothetical protein
VLLPCDDPEWSNFTKFFAQNFELLGLKKLISTSYAPESKKYKMPYQPTLFETSQPYFDNDKSKTHGKIFVLTHDLTGDNRIDINDLQWQYLEGDGDFRSKEIRKLRDEADIIVTNPPFSLFREFLAWIMEANKKFIIIGNLNAVSNKKVFPLIRDNVIWMGSSYFNGGAAFFIADQSLYDPSKMSSQKNAFLKDGQFLWRVNGVRWYTNIDHGRRHEALRLMTMSENYKHSHHEEIKERKEYQHYDNYEAIDVPFTDAIPSDYKGAMGVPISFLDKYCPEQFEIIGLTQFGCHDKLPDTRRYNDYKEYKTIGDVETGSSGAKTNENAVILGKGTKKTYYKNADGRIVHSKYNRLLIRKKQ